MEDHATGTLPRAAHLPGIEALLDSESDDQRGLAVLAHPGCVPELAQEVALLLEVRAALLPGGIFVAAGAGHCCAAAITSPAAE